MIDENSNLSKLPEGWLWTRLGEVCLDPQYGWTTSAAVKGSLHLLRTTDITAGDIHWDSVPFCKQEPPEKQKYLIKDGDIVISRAGSVGYSHLIRIPKEAVFASYLIRFRPLVDEAYLAYFLKSPSYWESISEKSLGIAIPNVNASKLKQVVVPLAPLPEQHRIVAKIEELFTRLDAGEKALKQVKAQLGRYRQAVLKHAFEGELTEEWREAHKDQLEPASVLLERISEERRKNAKGKVRELPPLNTSDLPELLEGWALTKVGDILQPSGEKVDPTKTQIMPYIGLEHIEKDKGKLLGHEKSNKVRSTKTRFYAGDLLYGKLRPYLNKVCVADFDGVCSTDILVFSKQHHISNRFLCYRFLCSDLVAYASQHMSGVQHPRVSFGDLSQFPLSLPPLPEQHHIVEEIEHRFSLADEVEKTVEQCLMRGERLRQSILKRTFEGKLVPQDPTDEPAEKLLEHIRVERARIEAEKKATGKTRRS